jgi:peptidoglycan/LPS O-acetylase OafA/YrhL
VNDTHLPDKSTSYLQPAPPELPLPPPENKLYYPALDGLRALAVLGVFTAHYTFFPQVFNWGWSGVDLFFVLSGFLITGILFDSQHRPDRFRVFYIRRTLRIFPLYYGVILLPLLLEPILRWSVHQGLWLWPIYLGNYARLFWSAKAAAVGPAFESLRSTRHVALPITWQFDHLWSLCVEEQFYLIWPALVFFIGRRVRLRNLCFAVVIIMPVARLICLHCLPQQWLDLGFLYRVTPLRADTLLLGGVLALCLRGPEARLILRLARPVALLVVGIFAAYETINRLHYGSFIDPAKMNLYNPWSYSLIALFSGAILLLALQPDSAIYRICTHGWLRALGQRSYGFYVYHLLLYSLWEWLAFALCFGHRRFLPQVTIVVALVGTIVVSWLSFRFFEAPLLRLKSRWAR